MPDPILSNLVFTKSTGRRDDANDVTFNDAITYGGFPAEFKIKGISQIEIFSDRSVGYRAFIIGLTIRYDGVARPVSHGIVDPNKRIEIVTLDPRTELLVGIHGRLKDLAGEPNDKRVGSIGFVVLDVTNGAVKTKGPFQGTPDRQSTPWASFGPIVAFQGTTKDGIGITTLGLAKTLGEAPRHLEVLENNTESGEEPQIF